MDRMFEASFRFAGKGLKLVTNSQRLFNYLIKQYGLYITEECGLRKIELLVEPTDNKRVGKQIREFSRHIQFLLCRNNYCFFHGAAVAKDGKAKLFLGPSNTGKTTISLFASQKGFELLSDEICLINKKSFAVTSFQTTITHINPYTRRLFKERGIPFAQRVAPNKNVYLSTGRGLAAQELSRAGILFAKNPCPIDKIYIFREYKSPLSSMLHSLCYPRIFCNLADLKLASDLRFLFRLLEKCDYQIIPPFNLSTIKERKLSYERMMKLLELV